MMEVIPAIDIRAGRAVRLQQGDYRRETVFDADPVSVAARWLDQGAARLHVVDLDGARDGSSANRETLRHIIQVAGDVPVQLGGGIRSPEQVSAALALGADRVIMGTAAIENPEILIESASRFPRQVVLGLDAREGRVAIRGWLETSRDTVDEVLARYAELDLAAVLYTDIQRDGMLDGPNVEATARLARTTRLPVIASGGVGCTEDLVQLARERVIAGAVVGRALYTGAVDLRDALEQVARC